MRLIKLLIFILIVFIPSINLTADEDLDGIKGLVISRSDKVILLLQDKKKDNDQEIIDVLTPIIDFKMISGIIIDDTELDNKEIKKDLSIKLQRFFISELRRYYDGQTIEVKGAAKISNRIIFIICDLVTKRKNIEFMIKFFNTEAGWKAYDVEVFGISLVRLYRSQIKAILE